jgi:predicted enzyme related to lactoylglutathione lyase
MSEYAPGAPCWVDLGSPDVEASKRFYTSLFGWTAETSGPEYGGYTNFFKDGKMVGAVGPLQGPGQPPVWTTYFKVNDAAATAARVEELGGKVLTPPMEVAPFGRMAIFIDQAGGAFGAWQPHQMTGLELLAENGAPCWFELLTRDVDGSRDFYPAALGVTARDVGFEGGTYTLLEADSRSVAGMVSMEGMGLPPEVPPHWVVYFAVEDADAVAERTRELGGSVPMGPADSPAGRFALLADPHGSTFAVIKPDPTFQP